MKFRNVTVDGTLCTVEASVEIMTHATPYRGTHTTLRAEILPVIFSHVAKSCSYRDVPQMAVSAKPLLLGSSL